ncbi:hypothetical protein MBLNU230_g1631t1 [Neophaeotheca triangularis]
MGRSTLDQHGPSRRRVAAFRCGLISLIVLMFGLGFLLGWFLEFGKDKHQSSKAQRSILNVRASPAEDPVSSPQGLRVEDQKIGGEGVEELEARRAEQGDGCIAPLREPTKDACEVLIGLGYAIDSALDAGPTREAADDRLETLLESLAGVDSPVVAEPTATEMADRLEALVDVGEAIGRVVTATEPARESPTASLLYEPEFYAAWGKRFGELVSSIESARAAESTVGIPSRSNAAPSAATTAKVESDAPERRDGPRTKDTLHDVVHAGALADA